MQYIGEHLWAGQLGNCFVILSFVAALLAALSYFSATSSPLPEGNGQGKGWIKIARLSFLIHVFSVFGMVGTLFIMLSGHYFEYEYIWHHSSKAMPMQYIASCFWEGQEGSFLLWIFWNAVLGIFLMKKLSSSPLGEAEVRWESPVMAVISLVQVFLCSMILGVYVLDYRIGSNPFTILLREFPDFKHLPFVQQPDYLSKLDGKGLNPLLQNYWMVIHPPTLFLGFALTVVPFAFAIAGLWKKKYSEWQRPALPWTFLGIMILGTGILMGGAWAYEALSFGGFWAWDPVENASLVPWLVLVGAGHVMMIYKNKGQSLFATFFLSLISFILVLYATFLTRSGILGDSSVHAFTDLGMSGQLLVYLLFFVALAIVMLAINFKKLPGQAQEDSIWSREFWMFIGALILLISAFQITLTTSIPLINKIFGSHLAPPAEGKAFNHYHQWQIPFAILILTLLSCTQFLKYKNSNPKEFRKNIVIPLGISLVLAILISFSFKWFSEGRTVFYALLLFTCIFAVFANITYIVKILKGKLDHAGASIAHIGFGMVLMGAMISTSRSEKISVNQKGDVSIFGKEYSNQENILLQQNDTVRMDDYFITYNGKRKAGVDIFYDVEYLKKNADGSLSETFTLSPRIQLNQRMGNVPEPDTKHYLTKDIYTHITYADLEHAGEQLQQSGAGEYKEPHNNTLAVGDTFFSANSIIVLEKLNTSIDKEKLGIQKAQIAVGAKLKVLDVSGKMFDAMPVYYITDSMPNTVESKVEELGLKFSFWQVNPSTGKIDISVSEKTAGKKDFIVMKAIVFPYINVLWMGCIIMVIGTVMAIRRRLRKD
ncbi:MAG: cytochrome c biogenesis protein CcsA [Bacteroidetes bacterium]|nr:cytochrome c biogenesis protein CcsA [Bacteroidota bacterium]